MARLGLNGGKAVKRKHTRSMASIATQQTEGARKRTKHTDIFLSRYDDP
jgi:hypothetical protein